MISEKAREEIRRIVEQRHPHLLPLDEDVLRSVSESQVRPSSPSDVDCRTIENLWEHGCAVLLVAGAPIDLAYWAAEQTVKKSGRVLIVLSESQEALVRTMLQLYEGGLLDRPGLYWVETDRLCEQLTKVFKENSLFFFKPATISCHFASGTTQEQQSRWQERIADSIHDYLAEREAHNRRFTVLQTDPPEQRRVWGYAVCGAGSYVHGHMLTALGTGFREIGIESEICPVEPGDPSLGYRLLDSLTRCRPSVFLSLNKQAKEDYAHFLDPATAEKLPQNRLVWLVDHPSFTSAERFDERDKIWACDKSYADAARRIGARDVFVNPPAADLSRDGTIRDEFRCKVLFVGIYHDASSFLDAMAPQTRERIEQFIEEMLAGKDVIADNDGIRNIRADDLEKSRPVFEEFCKRLNKDFSSDLTKLLFVASVTAGSRKRAEAVRALLPYGVRVYGNDAWSSVLGDRTDEVFRGIAPRSDVPDIYASADIVLNCHSPQLPNGLNVRDFNVLRARGCLLSDWVADMDAGFLEPGKDLLCYRTMDELLELTEGLIHDPDGHEALAQSGYQTVLNRHLYRHRAEWILSWLAC